MLDYTVALIKLIFQPIPYYKSHPAPYLAYMEQFKVTGFDDAKGLHELRRAHRKDGSFLGDIVRIDQICTDAEVVPAFGDPKQPVSKSLNGQSSMHRATAFFLNTYCDPEVFYSFEDILGQGHSTHFN